MRRHPFDPVSAVLGILAVAVGILVASANLDDLGDDAGAWIAAGVLLVGLAMIPWSRWRPRRAEPDRDAPPG